MEAQVELSKASVDGKDWVQWAHSCCMVREALASNTLDQGGPRGEWGLAWTDLKFTMPAFCCSLFTRSLIWQWFNGTLFC